MELPTQTARIKFDSTRFAQALRNHIQLGAFPDPNGIGGVVHVEVDIDGTTYESRIYAVVSDQSSLALEAMLAVVMPADHPERWFVRLIHASNDNVWNAEQQLYIGEPHSELCVGAWHEK
jgi:hypothetical protein